jgi:hypothetical protein
MTSWSMDAMMRRNMSTITNPDGVAATKET